MRAFLFIIIFTITGTIGFSQCTTLGQTPPTAFPVCGTTVFTQQSVPICSSGDLVVPGCSGDGALYSDKNPFWYKFTCYQSGTLGFVITPLGNADDYDWQLWDVTGMDPNSVLTTSPPPIISGNWSGSFGTTGASASGVNFIQCGSDPTENKPKFAIMPQLIVGHNYLLLISHFSDNQTGYTLAFGGGTAVITDPLDPHLLQATAPCDGTEIRLVTNKKIKCNSLAANGSDFKVISPAGTTLTPISASAIQCSNGFDLDTLSIFMAAPLAPGTYTVTAINGSDGNTLKDNCDKLIPVNESVQFTVFPLLPTPLDSLSKLTCAPQTLELVFRKKIKCNSIAPNGGDFFITGPYPVTITGASGNCINGETDRIFLQLSAPLTVNGNFFVNLQTGPDGNTLFDECDVETPLPDDVAFHVSDTVNADFSFTIAYSCDKNVVSYAHPNVNGVNIWHWTFGSAPDSFIQNPVITYTDFTDKATTLMVSNGVCSDTSSVIIKFDNYLKADFDVTALVCPDKKATFINNTIGRILTWKWNFGNGITSNVKDPAPQTFSPLVASDYTAMPELIVMNDYFCFDTISKPVLVVYSCFIAVPSAFTPNGDGLNDFLYPLKAYKSANLRFSIYNRLGQRVFFSTNWLDKWDGRYKGIGQDPGSYVWILEYDNTESGKHVFQKGTTILIR